MPPLAVDSAGDSFCAHAVVLAKSKTAKQTLSSRNAKKYTFRVTPLQLTA
jgi:hypothetical protein